MTIWEALGEYHGPPSFKVLVRYVVAKYSRSVIERSYRAYVTDSLRLAPQMMYLTSRWVESVDMTKTKGDNRTADEIVDDVVSRLEG